MPDPTLNVCVVICAYTEDRWADLIAAIDSVKRQRLRPAQVIVVVDHNPRLLSRLRAVVDADVLVVQNEGSQGLSTARNSGIAASSCPLIAFLDDDAIAQPDWLLRLAGLCQSNTVLGAGGWVEPRWSGVPPAWFPDEFLWVVGCSYRGQPKEVAAVRNPFGGCMCVRREVFEVVGGFRQDVGRVGALPVGCEETELCIRAQQELPNAVFMFDPGARIHHRVPAQRTTLRYFLARCFGEGWSKAMISRLIGSQAGLSSERAHVLRVLPRGVLNGLTEWFVSRDVAGLQRAAAIGVGLSCTVAGFVWGWLHLLLQRNATGQTAARMESRSA